MTVHCGEADGSDSVWYAMSHLLCSRQETKRFGHGVRILEDDELTKRAVKHGLFFELCPTSNLNTKMFSGYDNYPVKTMLNKGLRVTINTDNCAVSNTTIENEFEHIICGNNLDSKDVEKLLRNSVDASFANKTLKKQMHKKIDNHIF